MRQVFPILSRWQRLLAITALSLVVIGTFCAVLLLRTPFVTAQATIVYAKPGGLTSGTCDTWTNACNLQTALENATSGKQIWVAAGVYKPTSSMTDRTATFTLTNGVAIYGGFEGNETSLSSRDWTTNKTILSGDIDGNDTTDTNGIVTNAANINGANSYHVVVGSNTNNSTILDGFIITAGQADDGTTCPGGCGGGIFISAGNPTLRNVTVIGNLASFGGGIRNEYNSNPMLINMLFTGNTATTDGGGGGVSNSNSSNPTLTNVTISGNTASSTSGGGIRNTSNSSPMIQNSIIWGNTPTDNQINNSGVVTPVVRYSIVEGGYTGTGNKTLDPQFVAAGSGNYRLQAGSPAIDAGSNSADLDGSGSGTQTIASITVDIAGNVRIADGDNNGTATVDMGAYEVQGTPPTSTPTSTPTQTPIPTNKTCTQADFLAAVAAGDATVGGTIKLDGNCIYTLTSANDTSNGGNGRTIFRATTIEGNGAIIERGESAPQFRLITTNTNITIRNLTMRGGNVGTIGGGAIFAFNNLTLVNVRFENNKTTNGRGGAVRAYGSNSTLVVENSFFVGSQSSSEGGAISFNGQTGSVKNTIFANNISGWPGSAMEASKAGNTLTFVNNTVTNLVKSSKEALSLNGSATIKNTIFDNVKSAFTATGGTLVTVTEDYNLFAANDIIPQSMNNTPITRGSNSRTAASPRFVNAVVFNYHLQSNSPAVDLGGDAGVTTDADGLARPFAATATDIGAYEYQGVGIPSISIVKVGPPYIGSNGAAHFALTVINESTSDLDDLRIVEQLPEAATYVEDSASDGGVFADGTLTWDLSTLAPNQSKRVEYHVTTTQTLVSDNYRVSSVSNPAITTNGPTLTTPFDASFIALGFFPYPDGYSFPNWGGLPAEESDLTTDDMAFTYGADKVCKVQSPSCILTAAAEAWRQAKLAPGGHCFGMALEAMLIYDRADVAPGDFQTGAILIYDLAKANARRSIEQAFLTQMQTPLITAGLPPSTAAKGPQSVVDVLKVNLADPTATDRYVLTFWKTDWSGGHAVTPYAVRQIDANTTWIYVYDNNYPNNFDRVFKITRTGDVTTWVYEGGATVPGAPVSAYNGDDTTANRDKIQLKSLRYNEKFPKVCSSSAGGPCATTTAQMAASTAEDTGDVYEFELDGEGYVMITRSDGLRAGFDPTTGDFIGEIPGSEQVPNLTGLGLNIPNNIRIPHTTGMSYTIRIADRLTEYGNPKATANLNMYGPGFITRLKDLQLDTSENLDAETGNNDVVGVVFLADTHQVIFTSSMLDSDTPSLNMAVTQSDGPDYSFEVGGAQMSPGHSLAASIDPSTGRIVIENNDGSSSTYTLSVARLNLDGSQDTYQSSSVSDGTGVGAIVELGEDWDGSTPPSITTNTTPTLPQIDSDESVIYLPFITSTI